MKSFSTLSRVERPKTPSILRAFLVKLAFQYPLSGRTAENIQEDPAGVYACLFQYPLSGRTAENVE